MIPLRDTIAARRTAWVTRLLVTLNLAVFLLELRQGAHLEAFIYRYGVVPSQWAMSTLSDWFDSPRLIWTLISSQFLHGSVLHLASNMLYLWIFADNVEDRLGHGRFLALYLVSGAVAALTQLLISSRSAVPMVGASGAIAGILGAYFLLYPSARIVTLVPLGFFWNTVELPAFLFLGLWFVLQWAQGLTTIGQVADVGGVAFWAHVGGFLTGLLGIVILQPRRRW